MMPAPDQHGELVKPPKAHALRVVGLLGSGQFASVWRVDDGAAGSSREYGSMVKRLLRADPMHPPAAPEACRPASLLSGPRGAPFASVPQRRSGGALVPALPEAPIPPSRHEYALKKCCKRTAAQEQKGIDHLLEEKQAQASLNHPTIVRLFDTFQARLPRGTPPSRHTPSAHLARWPTTT